MFLFLHNCLCFILNHLLYDVSTQDVLAMTRRTPGPRPCIHGFAPRPGHNKDSHKNGTDCLPAWQVCVMVGV